MKNIMVHLDHGPRTPVRLQLAVQLAQKFGARLLGFFAETAKAHSVGVVSSWPPEPYRLAADASKAAFEAATAGLAKAEWRDANRGSAQEVTHAIIEAAQHVDLAVLGQDSGDEPPPIPSGTAEQVILNCGRPVLVIPYTGVPENFGSRPLIAWNHSREAVRAVNDALPLMAGCQQAIVVSMASHPNEERAAAKDCLTHLACHNVKAEVEVLVPEGVGLMDLLLNRTVDVGADLLVMGGHGHLGFPYIHRGGGTRHILAHMTVPVLMSH